MKGMEAMLKPLLGILEVAIPNSSPENDASKFIEELIVLYIPDDLPKDLIRKFAVDMVNKNPEGFEAKLRDLNLRMLHFFNRSAKNSAGL